MVRPFKLGIAALALAPTAFIGVSVSGVGAAAGTDAVAATGATPQVTASWPEFRYDNGRTGYNPDETTLSTTNVGGLEQMWSTVTPADDGETAAAISNGTLYVGTGDGNEYWALNATTGAFLWSYGTPSGKTALTAPAIDNGIVYVGYGKKLLALKATNGHVLWKYATGGTIDSSPTVANGTVYFGSDDHYLYALKASTGTLDWRYDTGGAVADSPVAANGDVYVSSEDGNVYAIHHGTKLWSKPYGGASGPYFASAGFSGSTLFVGSNNDTLYALDPSNGSIIWSSPYDGYFSIAGDVLYVTSTSESGGEITALSTSDGFVLWDQDTAFGPTNPAVANGVLYVAGGNTVYAFDASTGGMPLWSAPTDDDPSSDPVVTGGVVYVGGANGDVDAFDLPPMASGR
jgi:eukaryotic-like serine/threonine-protein kinase